MVLGEAFFSLSTLLGVLGDLDRMEWIADGEVDLRDVEG